MNASPCNDRFALLWQNAVFAGASADALALLATGAIEETFAAGEVVVDEHTPDDRLYVIVAGRATAAVAGPAGPIRIATLEAGAALGEIVPPMRASQRDARVGAETPMRVLRIDAPLFHRFLAAEPVAGDGLIASAEDRLEIAFLAAGGPFARLDSARLHDLAARLAPRTVAGGVAIARAGDIGDRCYLLRAGVVDLIAPDPSIPGTAPVRLGPGALFGEEVALTEGPYAATARAITPCDVLVLHRDDFLALLVDEPATRSDVIEQFRLRDRPRRAPGIVVHERTEGNGRTVWILKDPRRGAYYRLTAHGWFLWSRLDGRHTIRDLVLAYLREFRAFAPGQVAGEVAELAATGFVVQRPLRREVEAGRQSRWDRAYRTLTPIVEYRLRLRRSAALVDRLYVTGPRLLFTAPGQIAAAVLAIAGLAAFFLAGGRHEAADAGGPSLLVLMPLALVAIVWHELGHAFTAKAFGREVRLGVGWYWFGPLLYVDTSDMWLAGKWPRIAVSIGGPYASFLLGSLAALSAWLLPASAATGTLWLFAFLSYIWVILNLDPLLEYDGYYVLADLLDRPSLRNDALGWLGSGLLPALRRRGWRGVRGHGTDLAYGTVALAYVGFIGFTTIATYRLLVEDWVATWLSNDLTLWIGWALAALAVASMAITVAGELRGRRAIVLARTV